MGVIPGFIFYVSRNPENVRPLVTSLTISPLFDAQCACVCVRVCGLCEFTCLFVYCPPLAQVGATGVRTNKHKRDFMPFQS